MNWPMSNNTNAAMTAIMLQENVLARSDLLRAPLARSPAKKSSGVLWAPSMGIALEVFVRRDELHDIHVFAAVRRTMREQRKRRVVGGRLAIQALFESESWDIVIWHRIRSRPANVLDHERCMIAKFPIETCIRKIRHH